MKTSAMPTIGSAQRLVEGAQVGRRLAGAERVPICGFPVFNDRAGGRQVIFVERNACPHVEEVPDCRAFVGGAGKFRHDIRDQSVHIQLAPINEDPGQKSEE